MAPSPTPGRPRRPSRTWRPSSTRPSPTATRSTRSSPRTTARRSASSRALTAKNYGFPPLSGQDGDPANLNNVALGKQYVDVWKNANELGKAAGAAALEPVQGHGAWPALTLPDGPHRPDRRSCGRPDGSGLHDPERHRRSVLHPPADPAHCREPPAGDRRRPDHQGRPVQGRRRRDGAGRLQVAVSRPLS